MAFNRSLLAGDYGLLFWYGTFGRMLIVVLLMIGRAVNVLIPRQLGIVTDELTGESGEPRTFCRVHLIDSS